ncbi:hypothetical protein VTO42DRAFT_7513 [Malbranchea cinnamomea]
MAGNERREPRTVLVAYGSETGNSQDVADELACLAERLHFQVRICDLDAVKAETLHQYTLTIFSVSTTGQGDFPGNSRVFWRSLLLKKLPPTYLDGVNFALFGLGDSSYPKFNWAARKLHKRLLQLGANELYPTGEADERHPEGLDGTFIPWAQGLRKLLLDKFPLNPGQFPIPDDVRLPPKWILSCRGPDANGSTALNDGSDVDNTTRETPRSQDFERDSRPIPNTVTATLIENTRVTPSNHWQDVRYLRFSVPELLPYSPGDILYITPKNFAMDVDHLISLMGWESVANVPLCFTHHDPTSLSTALSPPPIPFLLDHPGFTLRTLLTDYLDIMAIPRRSFFAQIAHFTSDTMHRARLLEFTKPEYIDEFYDYATRSRRSILEVLHEFDSVKIPWQQACNVFPILRGRQFSIASGGKLKRLNDGGTRFDLLVAIVRYQTVIRKIRQGVCTRYLAVLPPGSTLKVRVQKGGLNPSMKQLIEPSVLIGPGTGIAPIRSLLWEKAAMAEAYRKKHGPDQVVPIGPIVLLYGGRNRAADYYFEEEWEELKRSLDLTVLTAFSRDQKHKVYVQDRIRENRELFFKVLYEMQGTVFICGSSGKMPQAVREALVETFQQMHDYPASNRQDAERYLMGMEKVGRYRQETW